MRTSREESLQALIEKMRCVMKSMHVGHPFGELTLGRPQVGILFFIARKKTGVSVKDLAEMLSVTSGAVTQFIDSLVEKDLVRREEDANDRRVLKITLTNKAEDRFKEFKKNYFQSVKPLFDDLTDKEILQLLTLLQKINTVSVKEKCKI